MSVLCFELFANAFAFLVESQKLGQKALPNRLNVFDIGKVALELHMIYSSFQKSLKVKKKH